MLLQRIKAHNYRTYLDLDLDLTVSANKPLVLIGGANGGGKSTLFDAIAGALYGLQIPDVETFIREVNAGAYAAGKAEQTIELELWFSGQILAQQQQYVLTRTWILNSESKINWGVKLNMAGNIFAYGSASTDKERAIAEAQVNKIIKANLPKELSQYFLFDAMTAGKKLSEDQLGKVIRENIENVMGLRKFLDLGSAARSVQENWKADRLKAKAEREEYLKLTEQQRSDETKLRDRIEKRDTILGEQHTLKELVSELQASRDQEGILKHKLDSLEKQRKDLGIKETQFRTQMDEFVKNLEPSVGLPFLANKVRSEVLLILEKLAEQVDSNSVVDQELIRKWVAKIFSHLQAQGLNLDAISQESAVQILLNTPSSQNEPTPFASLESSERSALDELVHSSHNNVFPALDLIRQELILACAGIPAQQTQAEELRARLAGKDYSDLKRYEELGKTVQVLEQEIDDLRTQIHETTKKIHQYDVTPLDEPDPRFDTACNLKAWFEEAADELHKSKKRRIESILRDDLNKNLAAYRDVIDRVELSENLRNLSFRIFHKAGNEIYLGQLNAASKQVVIQVLLKALHESGDYDPPVMIDTVMGVLDRDSRAAILKNYFPSLSHQTILLSTDSEIDPERDWKQLEPYISKAWTLVRDRDLQMTTVAQGYFGNIVEDL